MAKNKKNTTTEVSEKSKEESKKKYDKNKIKKTKNNKIVKWCKDLKIEFKKVVWPTKEIVVKNTIVVLSVIIIFAVFVGLIDTVFYQLLKLIYQQK